MQVLGHNDYYKAYDDRYKKVYKDSNIYLKNLLTNIKSMLKYNLINLRRRLHEKKIL